MGMRVGEGGQVREPSVEGINIFCSYTMRYSKRNNYNCCTCMFDSE